MKIKKFSAGSLKEAVKKMKDELGDDAAILSTRLINPDDEGPKIFEIIAGTDVDSAPEEREKKFEISPESDYLSELRKLAENIERKKQKEIKTRLSKNKKTVASKKSSFDLKKELNGLGAKLLDNETDKNIVSEIIKQLYEYRSFLTKKNLEKYLLSVMSSMIRTENFKFDSKKKPVTFAFVGPTGVGKTTCIAKLATISKILHQLNVGIISIDTFRLGAIDQLRIFSDIIDIDMLVAYEKKDMVNHLKAFKNKDIIFIDTAGRSQNNKEQLKQNLGFLKSIKIDYTYLTLSATSSSKNMLDNAKKFEMFDYSSFIITKMDEGFAFGNILNLLYNSEKPVVYLTNGQVIPDDIISADSDYLSKIIFTGKAV